MICYICEKTISESEMRKDIVWFNMIECFYDRKTDLLGRCAYGFHTECLKDSLGEDFWLFYKEKNK